MAAAAWASVHARNCCGVITLYRDFKQLKLAAKGICSHQITIENCIDHPVACGKTPW